MKFEYFFPITLVCFASLTTAIVESYYGQYPDDCPIDCAAAGHDPANWSRLHRLKQLQSCTRAMILDLNVQGLVDDPETFISIRACTTESTSFSNETSPSSSSTPQVDQDTTLSSQKAPLASDGCVGTSAKFQIAATLGARSRSGASSSSPSPDDVGLASKQLFAYFNEQSRCGTSLIFSKVASAIVGVYSGAQVEKASAAVLAGAFATHFQHGSASLQVCRSANASFTFGAYAPSDLAETQEAVKAWANGLCLDATSGSMAEQVLVEMSTLLPTLVLERNSTISNQNSTLLARHPSLQLRGDCDAKQVIAGDSCAALADRCHIAANDIYKYNTQPNFCSTLKPGQWYCCSSGSLPDKRPQPDSNGNCHAYPVAPDYTCAGIAAAFSITEDDIMDFNKNTWGWSGCGPTRLQAHQTICLSRGEPPMPQQLKDVTCGPQVIGTKKIPGLKISDLNPCPLNACCDVWGYCGTTAEFCTPTPADTGAPGTAQPHTNGCISNCGTDLVNNGVPPSSFIKLGYYEAFNYNRNCLHMSPEQIPEGYSHIHFAFATVTKDFAVDISSMEPQFKAFKDMIAFKRVLSFGGWDFSTGPDTFQRFRDATKPQNRATFVNNLLHFMEEHHIDGFDFDWEYPGAPDIPDIPPGGSDEGDNYLGFISLLRGRMGGSKSLSIALPASFWYLRPYNVKEMAKYLDYFVYMTYDLHGQWDVSNKWAVPGCEAGNCLRSHVNKTETLNALVMLTKAGVSSTKIIVGITSYGRSFRMADEHCAGPLCTFLGARGDSRAYKGRCTATAGYISNAELKEIASNHGSYSIVNRWVDDQSDSNIMTYGNPGAVDWVAYLDDEVKVRRVDWIKNLNFGGTTDWAIDLESFIGDDQVLTPGGDVDDGDDSWLDDDDSPVGCDFNNSPSSLQELADQTDRLDPNCLVQYGMDVFYDDIQESVELFGTNSEGYDQKFGYYVDWVKETMNSKLRDFIDPGHGEGFKYFDCTWKTLRTSGSGHCSDMPHLWEFQEDTYTIRYDLRDHDGFFDALDTKFGIEEDWIKFGDITNEYGCGDIDPGIAGDSGRPGRGGGPSQSCHQRKHILQNVPRKKDDKDITVGNPKDVIEKAWTNITALQDSILVTALTLAMGTYGSNNPENWYSGLDIIQAYSMPVLQLRSAVESMKTIKDIGEHAFEDKRRTLILEILSIIFMVVPFVGEGLGAIAGGVAAISRIFTLVAEGGNFGTTVREIVANPKSAPFAILGLLVGSAGLAGGEAKLSKLEGIEAASSARGLIKDSDIGKFPQSFKDRDALIQKITKGCN